MLTFGEYRQLVGEALKKRDYAQIDELYHRFDEVSPRPSSQELAELFITLASHLGETEAAKAMAEYLVLKRKG